MVLQVLVHDWLAAVARVGVNNADAPIAKCMNFHDGVANEAFEGGDPRFAPASNLWTQMRIRLRDSA